MVPGSSKCSSYVRLGKKCSGPNIAQALIANMSARDKVDREIADAERQLSEALARLSRLRRQRDTLSGSGTALLDRGLAGLEAEEEPDSPRPMSEEQSLIGQAQSLGAFGIVDWEAIGMAPYMPPSSSSVVGPSFLDSEWPAEVAPSDGRGASGGTPVASQGSGGS
ncbi:hypothetical protein VTI28DRAFT_9508 [Corynascus sepedonium]